jgi:hypothetical protein
LLCCYQWISDTTFAFICLRLVATRHMFGSTRIPFFCVIT